VRAGRIASSWFRSCVDMSLPCVLLATLHANVCRTVGRLRSSEFDILAYLLPFGYVTPQSPRGSQPVAKVGLHLTSDAGLSPRTASRGVGRRRIVIGEECGQHERWPYLHHQAVERRHDKPFDIDGRE
jgi:hypothetical protein